MVQTVVEPQQNSNFMSSRAEIGHKFTIQLQLVSALTPMEIQKLQNQQ